MIRTVQITDIEFDCSLEDDDWTEKDQLETEENLPKAYIGQVYELEVDDDADDYEVTEELLDEVSCASGWCINSIDFRYVLS
jgi:hypothetical protein